MISDNTIYLDDYFIKTVLFQNKYALTVRNYRIIQLSQTCCYVATLNVKNYP